MAQSNRRIREDVPEGYSIPEKNRDLRCEGKKNPTLDRSAPSREVQTDGEKLALPKKASRPERVEIEQVRKPKAVMHLVARIERAMSSQDTAGAKVLIQELAELKGKRDDYVLKLTAFWHMKQADFDEAASLLLEVLERRPNDLEAGLNMAIVELKRGHIAKAKKRLSKLRDIYPAHETVGKLIQQLGG